MGPDELPPYVSSDGEGPPAYVAWADTEVVEVKAASGQLARQLIALVFEWNPCEIFEWLSEHGWLQGPFFQIAWMGPGRFVVREATWMLSAVLRQLLRPRAMIWTWPGSL